MINKRKAKVLIVSDAIPPDYSGAGQSAMSLAKNLFSNDQLYGILTRTKETPIEEVVPAKIIYRFPIMQAQLNNVYHLGEIRIFRGYSDDIELPLDDMMPSENSFSSNFVFGQGLRK